MNALTLTTLLDYAMPQQVGLDEQGKNHKVLCGAETLEHIQHAIDNTAEILDAGLESLGWMIWHVGAAESAKDGPNLGIDSGQLASLGWLLMELTRARGALAPWSQLEGRCSGWGA